MECSDQRTYFAKVDGSAQKPRGTPLSRARWPFWGPWWPFWIIEVLIEAGGEVLQAVSECPPSPLDWYLNPNHEHLGPPMTKNFPLNYWKAFSEIRPYQEVLVTNLPYCVVD